MRSASPARVNENWILLTSWVFHALLLLRCHLVLFDLGQSKVAVGSGTVAGVRLTTFSPGPSRWGATVTRMIPTVLMSAGAPSPGSVLR